MTADDLKTYRPIVRRPVRGTYRGHRIVSMPPSSSGGVVLIEMLNILEGYRLGELEPAPRLHLMIEAMRRAYADRAAYLGDPAMVTAPLARLMSKRYAATLRAGIDPERATPSQDIHPELAATREGDNTTHFSVVDRYGNAVANTTTLNFSYGLGFVAEGTGVLLNNELDDFAAKPRTPNASGLVGGDANAPGPGKRPLSSMSPTIVLKNGKPFLVTGSPGASRIITTVLQIVVNTIDLNMPVGDAVAAPRIHHQWWPDQASVERGLPPARWRGWPSAATRWCRSAPALGQLDHGHAAGFRRRPRSAHARRAGGGVLTRHDFQNHPSSATATQIRRRPSKVRIERNTQRKPLSLKRSSARSPIQLPSAPVAIMAAMSGTKWPIAKPMKPNAASLATWAMVIRAPNVATWL